MVKDKEKQPTVRKKVYEDDKQKISHEAEENSVVIEDKKSGKTYGPYYPKDKHKK